MKRKNVERKKIMILQFLWHKRRWENEVVRTWLIVGITVSPLSLSLFVCTPKQHQVWKSENVHLFAKIFIDQFFSYIWFVTLQRRQTNSRNLKKKLKSKCDFLSDKRLRYYQTVVDISNTEKHRFFVIQSFYSLVIVQTNIATILFKICEISLRR